MPRGHDPIDLLMALDPAGRGVPALGAPGAAAAAAQALAHARRVLLATGFAVSSDMPETDGPPGTVILARALARLRIGVRCVTDPVNAGVLEAALREVDARIAVDVFPDGDPAVGARHLLALHRPTHLVAIERPGRALDGGYWTMRRESVTAWHRPVDALFVTPPRGITTVGIGDGGNEIGMGNVRARLLRAGGVLGSIACTVRVDHLVIAGVSNWGAYGVVAALERLTQRDLLHTAEDEQRLLAACVGAGAVDGITRRREPTADGLTAFTHAAFVELLTAVSRSSVAAFTQRASDGTRWTPARHGRDRRGRIIGRVPGGDATGERTRR